jgi:hypothetical protein
MCNRFFSALAGVEDTMGQTVGRATFAPDLLVFLNRECLPLGWRLSAYLSFVVAWPFSAL